MTRLCIPISLLLLSGCATATLGSLDAACLASRAARAEVAQAVAQTADPVLGVAAANLVEINDAACARG